MPYKQKFGSGYIKPVVYDTAWVARIHDPLDPKKPAFPQSLEWVRDQQLSDGSWGADKPVFPFDRIINTLIAIICLKQWNNGCDFKAIERGVEAMNRFLRRLEITDKMTVGFELILPSLIDEAINYGIQFMHPIIDLLRKEKSDKIRKIKLFENGNKKSSKNQSWWYSVEGLEEFYNKTAISSMVNDEGTICTSYSATAFALLHDKHLNNCFNAIQNVAMSNEGGIPMNAPIVYMDMAWSIGFLYISDSNLKKPEIVFIANKLEQIMHENNGILGVCFNLPPDTDCIANAIYALSACNKPLNSIFIESLLKFYRNDYFITFETERHPSMTTNIHCLMALKSLPKDLIKQMPKIEIIVGKVYNWLKKRIVSSNFKFEDKWHYSKYYPMSRSVIALEGIDNQLTKSIIDLMISEVQEDGGWGMDGSSTHEETAYVLLAYCYWIRRTNTSLTPAIIQILEKGKMFLNATENQFNPLWIAKVLYCPKSIVESLLLATRYAMTKVNDSSID